MLLTNFWKLLIYTSLLATIMETASSKKKTKAVSFVQALVEFNALYLENHTITINPDRISIDVILNIAQTFKRDAWVEIGIFLKNPKDGRFRSLFSYDVNVCQILGKDSNNKLNLVQMWINNFWKYGTLPKSCPISKGNYYWRGMKIDKSNLPPFLMNGQYRAIVNTYFRKGEGPMSKESVANLTIYLELK